MKRLLVAMVVGSVILTACKREPVPVPVPTTHPSPSPAPSPVPSVSPSPVPVQGLREITILATNDIHGHVEPTPDAKKNPVGGMAYFGGVVSAIREGLSQKFGARSGVLLVDAGDQSQGTLVSNYNEGSLVFKIMNEIGYDGVIPGNHDYDFGPIDWKQDQVIPGHGDQDRRGALKRAVSVAKFPLLSANTFYQASIVDKSGAPVAVGGEGCMPANRSTEIDWSRAERPDWIQPYAIKTVAGVRIAMIGIDNPSTPSTTTPDNVKDLCFASEAETYLRVRAELEGKADLFVILMHDGNGAEGDFGAEKRIEPITRTPHAVDVVIAGHTHMVNLRWLHGVPMIQSMSGGTHFGRVDLEWDPETRSLVKSSTKALAAIALGHNSCAKSATEFCALVKGAPVYEGVAVRENAAVQELIAEGKRAIAGPDVGAERVLGDTPQDIKSDRKSESALADLVTDAFRKAAGADIAFVNTGGIRTSLNEGKITYSDFFEVFPFANRAVVLSPMKWSTLFKLLTRSAQTCGNFGALMQSGLRVRFARDCEHAPFKGTEDKHAHLLSVETLDGEVLYDLDKGITGPKSSRAFTVVTLDFLAAGGSGFKDFSEAPQKGDDLGIMRDLVANEMVSNPVDLGSVQLPDGRWSETAEDHRAAQSETPAVAR